MVQTNRQDRKDPKGNDVGLTGNKKYLTEIKELPPDVNEVEPLESERRIVLNEAEGKQKYTEKPTQSVVAKETSLNIGTISDEDIEEDAKSGGLPVSAKDIVLIVVNFISMVLLVVILISLPKKSDELKRLRVEELKNQSNISYEAQGIDASIEKSQKLEDLFLDESGVVRFVNDIEGLRTQGTSISKINFANPTALRDKSGNFGIPLAIELTGAWDQLDSGLQKIDSLPYLFRPVSVEITRSKDDPKVIIFKYGIFIYVDDSFLKK